MPAPSVIQSFWEHLPILPVAPLSDDSNYRRIHAAAASTVDADPPVAWVAEHYSVLINLAQNPSRLPPNPPNNSNLRESIPQVENTHLLCTEADVLLNVAASLLMPPGGRLECRIEMLDPRIRTDVRWVYRHGNKTINVAVLEFKNTKVIHRKYFENAMTSSRGAAKKVRDAQELQPATYFEGNAFWLSKQAIKYYWPTECPDIAIFDWDVMMHHASEPVLAKGTWFKENGKNPHQGGTFRMVLYGFLVRALMRRGIIT
ncbi:hypothetical protein V8E54_007724 [Elaphomyces granulatus]